MMHVILQVTSREGRTERERENEKQAYRSFQG